VISLCSLESCKIAKRSFEAMSIVSPICIAPMIQWSDRYWRFLMRQITRKTLLYTEMTMDSALNYNTRNLEPFLGHDQSEYPLALQLGGCEPESMGKAAYLAESYGVYDSINVNAGCPSNRAKKCGFGAELMLEPELIKKIVYEMKRVVTHTDITVKCRLGVTNKESWEDLKEFIHAVRDGGVNHVIVHARTCILSGLSPAQNRTIPPLRHDDVHKLVQHFPEMKFTINGGIKTFQEAKVHLGWNTEQVEEGRTEGSSGSDLSLLYCAKANKRMKMEPSSALSFNSYPVHGVMIGREAYRNPWLFSTADTEFFTLKATSYADSTETDAAAVPKSMKSTRREILQDYIDYAVRCQDNKVYGSNLCNIMKPLHNFFCGSSDNGNQLYKRKLDDLLKVHTKSSKKSNSNVAAASQYSSPFESIVWAAVEGTIPDRFLDCRFREEGILDPEGAEDQPLEADAAACCHSKSSILTDAAVDCT
jgi:tRNA dihydrouridine synthase A